MKERVAAFLNEIRGAGSVLLGLVLILTFQGVRIQGTRRSTESVRNRIEAGRQEVEELGEQLQVVRRDREREVRRSRGHGPGGIRSPWEDYLFEGPTEARSALDLAMAVDVSGFGRFEYEGEEARVRGTFPPGAGDGAGEMDGEAMSLPVRNRIHLEEWPIEFSVESSWEALVDLTRWLLVAEPAFVLRALEFEVLRDGRGNPIDRMSLTGMLSTFWLVEEE